jgi:hypothetical protein
VRHSPPGGPLLANSELGLDREAFDVCFPASNLDKSPSGMGRLQVFPMPIGLP